MLAVQKEGNPTMENASTPDLDIGALRDAVQKEYAVVAEHPDKGFHFHTGSPLAKILGYMDE